ncbi:RNA-directed DNA polymerase, eukaryota [Tanacetum coccineum]
MESLHLSFTRAVEEGLFKGICLNGSVSISHLFYADDAMFIGEWSDANLRGIINILKCFFLASGLQININKSQVLGVGVPHLIVERAASTFGCSILQNQFRYLGVMVGESMSRKNAWADVVLKLRSRLSKWKVKTLSIGGRLTLLKSVLGASPLYNMSIFKVPRGVLKEMEAIRNHFFIGSDPVNKKITWIAWEKVLAAKIKGGLGVSSFHALNRALLLKWVWRFVSHDGSFWFRVIQAIYGSRIVKHSGMEIILGFGLIFGREIGLSRMSFRVCYALELDKDVSVADKVAMSVDQSFRRPIRAGLEYQQFTELTLLMDSVSLSLSHDRWVCDLSGEGEFRVKDIRNVIDVMSLPVHSEPTRWVKYIPIKVNVFAWRARRDCLPTRVQLIRRGVKVKSSTCPLCRICEEDIHHILFRCDVYVGRRLLCRLVVHLDILESYYIW